MNIQELIRALLLHASFQGNLFSGLTLALLARAVTGTVAARDNIVRESFSGFWFMGSDPAILGQVAGSGGVPPTGGPRAVQRDFSDLLIGALLARGYPLPDEFDVERAIREAEEFEKSQAVESSLHITTNEIVAAVTDGPSGNGLLIASARDAIRRDDKAPLPSSAIVSTNKLTNRSDVLPTATVIFTNRSTVTGNLVLNEVPANSDNKTVRSLVVVQGRAEDGTAVTGNVFRGQPQLPARPGFPAPLNTWETFNTRIP